jgi:MraZ protein
VRPTLLYGEHELTLDDKNRVLVPSEVRKALDPERDGDAFFLLVGMNQKPWLYPEKGYEALVDKRESELSPGEDMLEFDQMNFAMASKEKWDKQGRILVHQRILDRTKTNREVIMIGVRDHLEIWNRPDWLTHSEQLLTRRAEIASRAKRDRPTS